MGKTASKLSKDEISSLKKSTYFDKRELQQWYKGFLRDCPSGQLTNAEFLKIYKQFFPFGDPTDFANYIFNVFDKDKNGSIDFKEFIIVLSITSRGSKNEKLEWSYKLYDQNRDDKIDYQEMLNVLVAIYKMVGPMVRLNNDEATPELRAKKIFGLVNKDVNDMLDMDDFKVICEKDNQVLRGLDLYGGLV
ncbi:frequenin [Saccharomycopsis crataegensis]|uniref:Calcium-binding protein NCS-1 n=1 Tax=Saccharomycopsis crataegensis TaxID=43959 RepID=A0AAV5QP45_9ASCO|nr:frequenin [Saccharomycopsis crataegensis]